MLVSRYYHGCGVIDAQDGSGNKEVVVAGDFDTIGTVDDSETVEIYSVVNGSWRMGKYLLLFLEEPVNFTEIGCVN